MHNVFLRDEYRLSDEVRWVDVRVKEEIHYFFSGYIRNHANEHENASMIIFDVNDDKELNRELWKSMGFKFSSLGPYTYLPNTQGISTWMVHLLIPKGIDKIRIGFRTWKNQKDIILGKYINIEEAWYLNRLDQNLQKANNRIALLKQRFLELQSSWQVITSKPYTKYLEVEPRSRVTLTGKIRTFPDESKNAALIKVEFPNLSLDLQAIKALGLNYSKAVGPYLYLPTTFYGEHEWKVSFKVPSNCKEIKITYMGWHNKFPIKLFIDKSVKEQLTKRSYTIIDPLYEDDEYLPLRKDRSFGVVQSIRQKGFLELNYNAKGVSKNKNPAIVKFKFFDKNNEELNPKKVIGLTKSESTGFYKYISSSILEGYLLFLPPSKAVSFEMIFSGWEDDTFEILNRLIIKEHSPWHIDKSYRKQDFPKDTKIKIGYISSPESFHALNFDFDLLYLTKQNWEKELGIEPITILVVESTFYKKNKEWDNIILDNEDESFKELQNLIDFCQQQNIPTVFYAQNDAFEYNQFIQLAKSFNVIATSDSNYVESYKQDCGHTRVHTLPFSIQPRLQNPLDKVESDELQVAFFEEFSTDPVKYYSDLQTLLKPLVTQQLSIFPVSLQNDDCRTFHETYHKFLEKPVAYEEITNITKMFQLFVYTDPTENSRSQCLKYISGILASSTPVVSLDSDCIYTHYKDIVPIVKTHEEVSERMELLLSDRIERRKMGHLGYREVMKNHTMIQRFGDFFQKIGLTGVDYKNKLVTIAIATNRPKNLAQIKENISRQNYPSLEAIIVLNHDSFNLMDAKKYFEELPWVTVIQVPQSVSLGTCLNVSVDLCQGAYWIKMDDDDIYMENYISDLILPFKFSDAKIVGKQSTFIYLRGRDKLYLKYPDKVHQYVSLVSGATFAVERSIFEKIRFPNKSKGEDSNFLKKCITAGYKIYATDPYNYVTIRETDKYQHTWSIDDKELIKGTICVSDGLNYNIFKA